MSNLNELAERVERATGPDRELDGDVCLAFGWTLQKMKGDQRPYYRRPGVTQYYNRTEPPAYTSSLDAAMQLVPEGCDAHDLLVEAAATAWNDNCDFGVSAGETSALFVKALPRFVTAACLRAHHAMLEDKG